MSASKSTWAAVGVLALCSLLWRSCSAQQDACSATVAKKVKVFVRSTMEQGQWVTKVQLQLVPGNATNNFILDLEHRPADCKGVALSKMQVDITEPVPEGYKLIPDVGYYKFHTTPSTWEEGLRVCDQEGGHLAIINSYRESAALKELFHEHPNVPGVFSPETAFIGFHDRLVEGQYITVLGDSLESTGFIEWSPKYRSPDNFRGDDLHPGEDCGTIFWDDGYLNDSGCDEKNSFICEKELPGASTIQHCLD